MPANPRIVVYPGDLGRCGHRLIWPARALASQGADVHLVIPTDPPEVQLQAHWIDHDDGTREVVDVIPPDADVVVLQRPLQRTLCDAIPMLQAKGIAVVVEIDDDFTAMSRRNVSWHQVQPSTDPNRNWQWLAESCRRADVVTVTTPALAKRYGRPGRTVMIPNHVPASYLDVTPEPHDDVYVGWTGSIDTHPNDLQVTRGAVARAIERTGARFAVIGTGKGVRVALDLREQPVVSGWLHLENYPVAVAQLDVGLVPLEITAFNHAKSSLKGLEYAALGVPFVASPTDPYVATEVAAIADKPRDWERHIVELVTNPELRAHRAGVGREWAATQTIEGNCGQWWDAWCVAVNTACVSS